MDEHFRELAKRLNEEDGYWADLDDCTLPSEVTQVDCYLLRFGKAVDSMQNNLVVMGDLGLTWEPYRAYPTEQMGQLTGTDLEADLAEMKRVIKEWYEK